MGKLFGTDGIRGFANTYPMTVEVALNTGQAVARFAKKRGGKVVIIGKDTRLSGDMFEAALGAGITSMGIDVLIAGVIPTPAVALLTSTVKGAGAGVVISASHNPYHDNGIKVFKAGGLKLTDLEEEEMEAYILDGDCGSEACADIDSGKPDSSPDLPIEPGTISILDDAQERYADFLKACYERSLDKKIPTKISRSLWTVQTEPPTGWRPWCFQSSGLMLNLYRTSRTVKILITTAGPSIQKPLLKLLFQRVLVWELPLTVMPID